VADSNELSKTTYTNNSSLKLLNVATIRPLCPTLSSIPSVIAASFEPLSESNTLKVTL